jgi:hypothetical protein
LKIALVGPIPSISVRVSTTVNPGRPAKQPDGIAGSWARLRIYVGRRKDCPGWWCACLHYGFITRRGPGRPFGVQGRACQAGEASWKAYNSKYCWLRAPANPFNKSPIATTVAAPRSCGHDLNPQLSPFARSGCYGSSHDAESPPRKRLFQEYRGCAGGGRELDASPRTPVTFRRFNIRLRSTVALADWTAR